MLIGIAQAREITLSSITTSAEIKKIFEESSERSDVEFLCNLSDVMRDAAQKQQRTLVISKSTHDRICQSKSTIMESFRNNFQVAVSYPMEDICGDDDDEDDFGTYYLILIPDSEQP